MFSGQFLNTFKDSYMRNHKAVNTKNLRCFPICGEQHRDNGFCGNEVIVSWVTSGRVTHGDFETYAEFEQAEEPPRFEIGQTISEHDLAISVEDKDRKHYLMKGETKQGDSPNEGSLHFTRESKGWHYGWMAGRGNGSHVLHDMRVYLLERIEGQQMICRLIMKSSPFKVTSRKRTRKRKDEKGLEVEDDDDDDDDDDDGRKKRTKKNIDEKRVMPKKPNTPRKESNEPSPPLATIPSNPTPAIQPQKHLPSFVPPVMQLQKSDSAGLGPRFDTPGSVYGQRPNPPSFFMNHVQNQQGLPQAFQTMQPPAFTTRSSGVQWPFSLSSTPPIYQHPSTTPPIYTHPATTPPIFNLPFTNFGDFPLIPPPVTDSDVLDSLLGPTPPNTFPNMISMRTQAPQQLYMPQKEGSSG